MKKFVALAVASLGLAVGCTSQPQPEPDTSASASAPASASPSLVPSASSSPSAEPSPSPTSTWSPEQEAAVEAVLEYFRVQEEIDANLESSLAPLASVTDGNMLRMVTELVNAQRSRGHVIRGRSHIDVYRVAEPATVEGETRVVVQACMDSSDIQTIDINTGEPADVSPPTYLDYQLATADRDGWKVVDGGSRLVESCP